MLGPRPGLSVAFVAAHLLAATSATSYFVAPEQHEQQQETLSAAEGDGTRGSPLPSIAACVARLRSPGDECRLLAGTYREATVAVRGLRGTAAAPIVIAAAEGAEVVLDGTAPLSGAWQPGGKGSWELTVPSSATPLGGVTQLWLGREMATPARWPNALWSDRSVFNFSRWRTFNGSAPWGPSSYKRGQPMTLYDAGGADGLGASGLSAKGAMFIGNIAHDDTFVGTVTAHSAGDDSFEVTMGPMLDKMGNTKAGNSIYFLEGLPSFVDQPTEWAFSPADRKLRLLTADGASPEQATLPVSHKVQTYALNITDCQHLTLANLSFFGTTINAAGGIPHLTLDTLDFRYPSFSRRMLGDTHTPSPTVLKSYAPTPPDSSEDPPAAGADDFEVHMWWKPQSANTIASDIESMTTTLFVTDVILYCGVAVLENGTVGLQPDKPGAAPGTDGWGRPGLCPAAIDAATAAGLGVQVILEARATGNVSGVIGAAVSRGGAAVGGDVLHALKSLDPHGKATGVNLDFEFSGSGWRAPSGVADEFTSALAAAIGPAQLELTVCCSRTNTCGIGPAQPLAAGGTSRVFDMGTYTGNDVTPHNSHSWETKVRSGLAQNGANATGFVVGLMAQLEQPRPGSEEARAWQNSTASVRSRFALLRELNLRKIALFEWRNDMPGDGFFAGVWDGLAEEWRTQLKAFATGEGVRSAGAGHPTPTAEDSSFVVRNCSFLGADGVTFDYSGSNSVFVNNLFDSNDWTCHDDDVHTGMGCVVLNAAGGSGDVFSRNTMLGNGPSVGYSCGVAATMTLNRCYGQADIDNDGVCLQIRSSSATNSTMALNWVSHSAKGLRLDSGSNTAFVPAEVNNTIHANVALMTNGFELKNDYNYYTQNLALWPPPQWLVRGGASRASAVFRVDSGRFASENTHSIVEGNAASSWTTPLSGVTSSERPNVLDPAVGEQLRDPRNRDFRARPGTALEKSGAGPYASSVSAALYEPEPDAASADCGAAGAYWIPGRREWRPSTPVPPDGTTDASPDLDLMFLASSSGPAHVVSMGRSEAELTAVGPALNPGCNVQLLNGTLPLNSSWVWRVDARDPSTREIIRGPVWSFTVRQQAASPSPPPPAPPGPPAPAHGACDTCKQQHCPGQAGGGEACEACVEKSQRDFMAAGCFAKGDRHAFIETFCYPDPE